MRLGLRSLRTSLRATPVPLSHVHLSSRTVTMSSSDQVNQEELPKPRLYTWITANDMREMIVNPAHTARKDYVVVDVRDSDRVGGHITNSVHSPSEQFHGAVDELVEANKDAKTVVFHCALSQQRSVHALYNTWRC